MYGTKLYLGEPDGQNPFIDDTLWGRYLDGKMEAVKAFMADPANN